jgi:uncharacterized protein (DUF952 family)
MILHVCTGAEWQACSGLPLYQPNSYAIEGFIHCCLPSQLAGVLKRYFVGKTDLYLLTIDENKLTPNIIFEGSADSEKFPHVYGQIEVSAIIQVQRLRD